jgi:ATP-dependent Clp protease ATP-binding subunit ClpA
VLNEEQNRFQTRESKRGLQRRTRNLEEKLRLQIIGQDEAVEAIAPFVEVFESGLSPECRPAGAFLLMGPTGTGKSRTVEALAEALHGSPKHLLRIDCGEFHSDHEVARLIGAPPGYIGHRETQPLLSQYKLDAVASERSRLSILLFDEIEKAAPALTRLLLGILDKGTARMGDGSVVNFERTMIFLTSNLGAAKMMERMGPGFGLESAGMRSAATARSLRSVADRAMRKHFPPEFVNRMDSVITYRALDGAALEKILDLELERLQKHLDKRLAPDTVSLGVDAKMRRQLLEEGTSAQSGARELKRTIHRRILQPLARGLLRGMAA